MNLNVISRTQDAFEIIIFLICKHNKRDVDDHSTLLYRSGVSVNPLRFIKGRTLHPWLPSRNRCAILPGRARGSRIINHRPKLDGCGLCPWQIVSWMCQPRVFRSPGTPRAFHGAPDPGHNEPGPNNTFKNHCKVSQRFDTSASVPRRASSGLRLFLLPRRGFFLPASVYLHYRASSGAVWKDTVLLGRDWYLLSDARRTERVCLMKNVAERKRCHLHDNDGGNWALVRDT